MRKRSFYKAATFVTIVKVWYNINDKKEFIWGLYKNNIHLMCNMVASKYYALHD